MNAIPIIIPMSSNNNGSLSYTQRCLEETEFSDLYKKVLNKEYFTDKDTERLTACIDKKKEEDGKFVAIAIALFVFVAVALIVFIIMM